MDEFATEEQQVEAIKRFWRENGLAIAVGVVLGLGGLYGWRYYNDSQIAAKESASTAYEAAVENINADNIEQAQAFIDTHEGGYTVLAALQLAKLAAEQDQLDDAEKHLQYVATNASDVSFQDIANMRLARVQLALENYDSALKTIELVQQSAFIAQKEEIKGDIFVSQGEFEQAKTSYTASLEADENNQLVKMKLDNLAVSANG